MGLEAPKTQTPRSYRLKKIRSEETVSYRLFFFFTLSRMGVIVAHAIYIFISKIWFFFFFSKIGAARNLAGRNYAVTNIIYHFVIHVITPLRRGCGP